jgi:UDP-arabinose 4-epimerase
MRVLVTGGAGYIGSHTAKFLRRRGWFPVVLDDLSAGHRTFAEFGPFEQGDIRDEARVLDVIKRHAIEAVIHFAAKTLVSESFLAPEAYFSVNVTGMISLLGAMKRADVRRLVFSSSCAVYGPSQAERIGEDHALAPISPYGLSKLQAEQVLESVGRTFGLRSAVLRYFNVIGADPEGELYEWHEPETHLLPNLLSAALEGREFCLYGDRYPTADGTAIRDYVDVNDLARTHGEALDALEREERLVSNVGTGEGVSVRKMLDLVEQAAQRPLRVRIEPPRQGDPPRLVADHRCLLTWSAGARQGFVPLQESVRNALRAMETRRTRSTDEATAKRKKSARRQKPAREPK